jgi:ubiquinone/menaquinone biosynthesis C-methylase UbiE
MKNIFKKRSAVTVKQVADYYEHWTLKYMESFGHIFQSKQANTPEELTEYYIRQMGVLPQMKMVDAGCGIGGPACMIAQKVPVYIDCVTISPLQASIAKKEVAEKNLDRQVKIFEGDFHQLNKVLPNTGYDIVYFLESLVHSSTPEIAIGQAYNLLKPDGIIYIKDLYKKTAYSQGEEKDIQSWVDHNNKHIKLNIITKEELLILLRKQGFQLEFCQLMRIPTNQDLGNQFVTINQIMPDPIKNSLPPYLEWYEIKAIKPGPGLINKM